jgi:hypothetical protein
MISARSGVLQHKGMASSMAAEFSYAADASERVRGGWVAGPSTGPNPVMILQDLEFGLPSSIL